MAKLSFNDWVAAGQPTKEPEKKKTQVATGTVNTTKSPATNSGNSTGKLSFSDWVKTRGIESQTIINNSDHEKGNANARMPTSQLGVETYLSMGLSETRRRGGTSEDWYAELQRKNEEAKKAEEDAWNAYRIAQTKNAGGVWDADSASYIVAGDELTSAERTAWENAKADRAYSDYALKLAELQRYEDIDEGNIGLHAANDGRIAYETWKAKKDAAPEEVPFSQMGWMGDQQLSYMISEHIKGLKEDTSYWEPQEDWTDDQRRQFYVLFNRDMAEARTYGQSINDYNNAQKAYAKQQKAEEWSTKNAFTGALATAGALVTGASSGVDYLSNAMEYIARGTVTQKSYLTPADYGNVMTAAIASSLNEQDSSFNNLLSKLEPVMGEVGTGDIYKIGYNVLQNLTYGKLLRAGGAAAAYFGIGAKSGYEEAAARGVSPAKAFVNGLATGSIEYLTEKFSLDNLLSIQSPVTLKAMLTSALVQGGVEASEEELSLIGTTLVDAILNGDQSALRTAEEEYILQGYSATDAKKMAMKDWWKEAAFTAVSSFASGTASGGIQSVAQNVTRYQGDSQAIIDRAMLAPEGTQTRMTAEQYQKILDKLNTPKPAKEAKQPAPKAKSSSAGFTPSEEFSASNDKSAEGGDFVSGKAYEKPAKETTAPKTKGLTNAQAAHLTELSNESEIKSRLKAAGIEDENAVKAVTKLVMGERLSKAERNTIKETEGAETVAAMMSVENSFGLNWTYPESGTSGTAQAKTANKSAPVEVGGEAESIKGIKYEGNKLQINTDSGWHPASAVSLPAELQELVDAFAPYKQSAAEMFAMYESGQDIRKFVEAWNYAENVYGANTTADISRARKAFNPADLTDAQLEIAFSKGRDRKIANDTKAAQKSSQQSYSTRTGGVSYDGGVVDGIEYKAVDRSKLNDTQKRQIAVIEKLAKALKINFVLYESELKNGRYQGATGIFTQNTVYLDVNAGLNKEGDAEKIGKIAILRTAAHELTHYMQANNLEGYNTLKTFLLTNLSEYKGKNINDLILAKQTRAENAGNPIGEDEAIDEIVADGCEMMLKDTKLISKLAKEDRNLAEQIRDWFADFAAEIKAAFADIREEHEEARAMREYAEELQQIWEDALIKAAKSENGSDTGTRPDINKTDVVFSDKASKTQYQIRYPQYTAKDILRNSVELQNMPAVTTITGKEIDSMEGTLDDRILLLFKQWGNNIFSEQFGDVALTKSSMRSERRHGNTNQKIQAYPAIPSVVQNGVVIDAIQKNENGLERIVVAAPIIVGNQKYFMGVMLQRDAANQRLYAHDVVTEKEPTNISEDILSTTGSQKGGGLYISDILLRALNVKPQMSAERYESTESLNNSAKLRTLISNNKGYDARKLLGAALNDAGLVTPAKNKKQSKANIDAYLAENFPDLIVRYSIYPEKQAVEVDDINTLESLEESRKREAERETRRIQRERFWNRIKTLSGYEQLVKSVENWVSKHLPEECYVEKSRSVVNSMSFYIETPYGRIKISDHNTIGQQLGYNNIGFINLKELTGLPMLYDEISKIIERETSEGQPLYQARDILPDERDLLLAEAAKRGASDEVRRYRKKYREIERLRARLSELEQQSADGTEGLEEEIAKIQSKAGKATAKLRELEASAPIQSAMEKALAEWRSTNDAEAARVMRMLNEENEKLRQRVEYYKEEMQLSGQGNRKADAADVRAMAKNLIDQYGSSVEKQFITERLQELADYIISDNDGEGLNYKDINRAARKIATAVVDNLYITEDSEVAAYQELRSYLKSVPLKISDELRREAPEGIKGMRNYYFGRLRLENEGMAIDSAYQELAEMFGEGYFPSDITAHYDQIEQIGEALDRMAPKEYNPLTKPERLELSAFMANEIVDRVLSDEIKQRTTLADRELSRAAARNQSLREQLEEAQRQNRLEASQRRELVQKKVTELRNKSIERERAFKTRERIKKKIDRLYKRLKTNSKKENIPEKFKESVAAFLSSLDTRSPYTQDKGREEYAKRIAQLNSIVDAMQIKRNSEDLSGGIELPEMLKEALGEYYAFYVDAASQEESGTIRLDTMNLDELKQIETILSLINKAIETDTDERLAVEKGRISELAEPDIDKMAELGRKKATGPADEYFNHSNTTPVYFFDRLGEGAKQIFSELQKSMGKYAFHAQEIIDFAKKTYDGKLVKSAEEGIVELELYRRLPDDPENPEALRSEEKEKVQITKAQIMSLYALSGREAALTHLLGAGIRIGDIKKGSKTIEQAARYLLTMEELNEIVQTHLSEQERQVVDALVRYMSTTGSAWGNEISMKMYGIRAFDEPNYFPMRTDDTSRDAKAPEADRANMWHLINQSFTKALKPNAKNALILDSVFDVFGNHMTNMAKYNAFALSATDAMRYFNYKALTGENEAGQTSTKDMRTAMGEAFGKAAINYYTTFMQDLNGNAIGGRGEGAFAKMASKYKIASVGANMRVWMLQYSSIVRAGAVLDPKYISQHMALSGAALKRAKEEMQSISGDARWKKLGFRDVDINSSMMQLIKQDESFFDKAGELSMKLAELADERVWAILWESCKQEMRETKGLSGEELLQATEERFRDVVYHTQVMDSTLTKSQLMRAKGDTYLNMITSFMSEPTLSYNMMLAAYHDIQDESRRTSWGDAWQTKKGVVARAIVTYVATSAASAFVGSIANALRDDDEYQSFAEKFLEAFKGNIKDELNPLAKIPILRDIVSLFQGYDVNRSDMTSIVQAFKVLGIWQETVKLELGLQEDATSATYNGKMTPWGKVYETLKAVSQLTGLPIASLTRDAVSIYNSLVGVRTDTAIRTYDSGKNSRIKYAYKDGYMSAEEAAEALVDIGEESNLEDAMWAVNKWDTGSGKYDALREALHAKNDSAIGTVKETLMGKGVSEKDIESEVRSIVREAYQNKEKGEQLINKQEAIDLLIAQGGLRKKKAEETVQKWTCYVVEGIEYDDVSAAYIAGEITSSDAVAMRKLYGGYTEAEAEADVLKWQCEKDTGIAYDDMKEEFIDGELGSEEAVALRIKYGGVAEETAAATVLQWQCEKDTGIEYADIQQFYDASEITANDVVSMLMTYGGYTEADALARLAKFDFVDGDYSMNDITYTAVGNYNEYAKNTGMSTSSFYEYWKAINAIDSDKNAAGEITTNAQVKRWAYIDSLNISRAQKDAMHLSFYSARSLSKAPWN